MKSVTPVSAEDFRTRIDKNDRILVLGSCFAANMGDRLAKAGFDLCVNPFGTIFNPASIASSIGRLESATPFGLQDCVPLGAGAGLWGSFHHYTKFARPNPEEFLDNANAALREASEFFRSCTVVIVTFGTAFVFEHIPCGNPDTGEGMSGIVANCLKRPAREFRRYMLSHEDIVQMWRPLMQGALKGKKLIFTVSPVRHMADGAHGNGLSKATLLLAEDSLVREFPDASYFPSYEIVLDELRDYRWFAEDLVHPSPEAIDLVWERFRIITGSSPR